MRGEVLHYDEAQSFGFITGSDGNRYTFRREDLRGTFPVSKGALIEFRESGSQARDISPIGGTAAAPATAMPPVTPAVSSTVTTPAVRPQHFGRFAVPGNQASAGTGLWDYFRASMTSNYANFRGRARRKEYWGFVLLYMVAMIALSVVGVAIDAGVGNFDYASEAPLVTIALIGLFLLATFIPSMAINVRRFHDIGLSGWFYLLFFVLAFITIGGPIILIIGLIPSQKRENKWGPVPEGITIPPPYVQPTPAAPTPGTGQ